MIIFTPICPICKIVNSNKTKAVAYTPLSTICRCKECNTYWALAKNGKVGYKIIKDQIELKAHISGDVRFA